MLNTLLLSAQAASDAVTSGTVVDTTVSITQLATDWKTLVVVGVLIILGAVRYDGKPLFKYILRIK